MAGTIPILVLCIFFTFSIDAAVILNLDGDKWTVQGAGHNLPATVPGGIYSDLMRAEVIGDVFFEDNDQKTRWVSKENWTYSLNFDVPNDYPIQTYANLVFDGIDTFATVYLNNKQIGTTDNMFVRYIFDVKPHLKFGSNVLEVRFQSPVTMAQALYDEQAKNYKVPPVCVPKEYNGECHANHVRKMQASFSWDWGPALPSMGIWKSVYLESFNAATIRYVTLHTTTKDAGTWNMQFKIYFDKNFESTATEIKVNLKLSDTRMINATEIVRNLGKSSDGEFVKEMNLEVKKLWVDLWWPNGYGSQRLYLATVTYRDLFSNDFDSVEFNTAFRTVTLTQDPIRTGGRQFFFKINGLPIFAKGTNSIPINILPERGSDRKTIKSLLQSAKDVHMNMIRVWGGGAYEDDYFYELADEMGILIWQDFMFACSMYPATEDFLRNVREEVRHQVRRLQHHPSIALWAGNNENEAALRQNWYGTRENFTQYKNDYIKLYVDTIQTEVLSNDQSRPYLVSSPTNGVESEEEGHIANNPQDTLYGDVHFYNYIKDSWNTSSYPIPRFASEYGYQSLPVMETLLTATGERENLKWSSKFLEDRQHHPLGYTEMLLLINFRLPLLEFEEEDSQNFFNAFVYYCQILQAMAVKIETEFYRQWRGIVNDKGEGNTMGALYWQLNDVWVAPTWAGIDFTGKWKMLHYFTKNFFAPVIVTGNLDNNGNLNVYVVSDLTPDIARGVINVTIHKWDSLTPVYQEYLTLTFQGSKSELVKTYDVQSFLSNVPDKACGDEPTKNCFFHFDTLGITPDNFAFPVPLKSAALSTPDLQIVSITGSPFGQHFTVTISTDVPALFVWLQAEGIPGRFSDNGFLMVTQTETVDFFSDEPVNLVRVQGAISVMNLKNVNPVKMVQPDDGGGQGSFGPSLFIILGLVFYSLIL